MTSSSPLHKEIVQSCRNENPSLHLLVRFAQWQNASSGWESAWSSWSLKGVWHIGAALRHNMASLFKVGPVWPCDGLTTGTEDPASYLVLAAAGTRVLVPFETSLCSPSEWTAEHQNWVGSRLIWTTCYVVPLSLLHPVKPESGRNLFIHHDASSAASFIIKWCWVGGRPHPHKNMERWMTMRRHQGRWS